MRLALSSALLLFSATVSCSSPTPAPVDPNPPDPIDPPPAALSAEAQMVKDLAALRFDKLGHPVIRWDSIPRVTAPREKPHRLLVVLVEFADLRFEQFRGKKDQGAQLAGMYQEQLFDDGYRRKNTLSHYYYEQSDGKYHVHGKVLPPVRLSKKRRAYSGPNRPAGGEWRNDVDTEGMVEETLSLAKKNNADLDWSSFDQWDPIDHDKDSNTNEADGYIDHFVLVFAGNGQSSCQSLNKIDDVLTADVDNAAIKKLDKRQRECADRPWPHRTAVKFREGLGPKNGDVVNRRGGVPISEAVWVYDYNMQSEYTPAATFIHEFGHSIGLPDVYSRTSSNSTGGWEVMSSTESPSPQNLSAWSRLQLGWLEPAVVLPPGFGGKTQGKLELARLDDASAGAARSIMVVLPPKKKVIELTDLPAASGKVALYGGQGNEMNRTAVRQLDLSALAKVTVSFDAWWEIEAGWDFAYVEVSADEGRSWKRLVPTDRRFMPAKHGHDGKTTIPGLTGISGDLDGDGKNESNTACDPKVPTKSGEDNAGGARSPCQIPSWVRPTFDLTEHAGKADVRFRVRYFTDGAAVMRGVLFDNITVAGTSTSGEAVTWPSDDLESEATRKGWTLDGFAESPGRHELLVPHFYVIEYRDPYKTQSYDQSLASSKLAFYADPSGKGMLAIALRRRPGVVVWYADGAYAWSENDPAINGPGKGYALVVDANPNEIKLPGLEAFYQGSADNRDTAYDVKGQEAQKALATSFAETICFVRSSSYLPRGRRCKGKPAVQKLTVDGLPAKYIYEVINDHFPPEQGGFKRVGELVDTRTRKGVTSYRLRDRSLRYYHTFDSPFAVEAFERGMVIYRVTDNKLVEVEARDFPAVSSFSDGDPARWQNARLPFGGVAVPKTGFAFDVGAAGGQSNGAQVTIDYRFAPVAN